MDTRIYDAHARVYATWFIKSYRVKCVCVCAISKYLNGLFVRCTMFTRCNEAIRARSCTVASRLLRVNFDELDNANTAPRYHQILRHCARTSRRITMYVCRAKSKWICRQYCYLHCSWIFTVNINASECRREINRGGRYKELRSIRISRMI